MGLSATRERAEHGERDDQRRAWRKSVQALELADCPIPVDGGPLPALPEAGGPVELLELRESAATLADVEAAIRAAVGGAADHPAGLAEYPVVDAPFLLPNTGRVIAPFAVRLLRKSTQDRRADRRGAPLVADALRPTAKHPRDLLLVETQLPKLDRQNERRVVAVHGEGAVEDDGDARLDGARGQPVLGCHRPDGFERPNQIVAHDPPTSSRLLEGVSEPIGRDATARPTSDLLIALTSRRTSLRRPPIRRMISFAVSVGSASSSRAIASTCSTISTLRRDG